MLGSPAFPLCTSAFAMCLLANPQPPAATSQKISDGRVVLRGRVSQANGEPWSGAEVTLATRPWPKRPPIELLRIRADERGNFRARVLSGFSYACWCITEPDTDGRFRSTAIQSFRGGQRAKLKEITGGCMRTRVKLPAIADETPERLRIRITNAIPKPILLEPRDGIVTLPPVPGGRATVALENGAGQTLTTARVEMRVEARTKALASARKKANEEQKAKKQGKATPPELDLHVIDPPSGVWMGVRVLHEGKPVAGARITSSYGGQDGVSDGDGWARTRFPIRTFRPGSWYSVRLSVTADGYRNTGMQAVFQAVAKGEKAKGTFPDGIILEQERDYAAMRKSGKPDLTVKLDKGSTLSGRLWLAEGKPAANVALRCALREKRISNRGMSSSDRDVTWTDATTDADGAFAIHGCGRGKTFFLEALLDQEARGALPRTDVRAVAWIATGQVDAKGSKTVLPDIVLSKLPAVDIRCVRSDGTPARFAQLAIAGKQTEFYSTHWCDRLGKATLVVPQAGQYTVASLVGGYSLESKCKLNPEELRQLTLRAPVVIRGKITNGKGTALPGAFVSLSWPSTPKSSLLDSLSSSGSARTEKDGTYRIEVRPNRKQCWMWAYWRKGKKTFNPTNSMQVDIGTDDIEHDIEIPGAPDPDK